MLHQDREEWGTFTCGILSFPPRRNRKYIFTATTWVYTDHHHDCYHQQQFYSCDDCTAHQDCASYPRRLPLCVSGSIRVIPFDNIRMIPSALHYVVSLDVVCLYYCIAALGHTLRTFASLCTLQYDKALSFPSYNLRHRQGDSYPYIKRRACSIRIKEMEST